ncbi:hypothetical protein GQ607_007997 [Colletotrichum asianum]|uniref:Uncharacterized protein n=1 Tax=Colletotrichum asianum TaxID=702518 RepID=A0A8H3W9G0_9PEZI|nr:hypothetical protein GQ607_007997 [Colletotrichum asianum]
MCFCGGQWPGICGSKTAGTPRKPNKRRDEMSRAQSTAASSGRDG